MAGGEERRGGIAVDEFEDPAGGEVLDEQGEFGEGQGEEMMELVDEPGALADDGLESAGDLAEECAVRVTTACRVRGLFAEGEACGGAGLDGIGLLAAEEGGAIVLVALRIAAGDGEGQRGRQRLARPRGAWQRCRKWSRLSAYWPAASRRTAKWTAAVALGDAFESLAKWA